MRKMEELWYQYRYRYIIRLWMEYILDDWWI